MTALVECIPNISEGRDAAAVAAIASAAASAPGCALLDIHSDPWHHRSVITLAGPPEAVLEGAFRLVRAAKDRIDITRHAGEHPRIGATDVVPFTPLAGATMDDAIALARALADRVSAELAIPTVRYALAAERPEDRRLGDLRRREWPNAHPTAGVTAVGARPPLVAYNVNLETGDVTVAKHIAATLRESGGGLAGVQALGFLVNGRAQVSTNVFDLDRTTPAAVYAAVAAAAPVHSAEVVGLAPLRALTGDIGIRPVSVHALEPRLEQLGLAGWISALGAPNPAPAGVAAAAASAAMAAALVAMVAGISRKKGLPGDWDAIERTALAERDALMTLAPRDGAAVRSGDVERTDASAAQVAERAAAVAALAEEAARNGYAPARPDARTGALLARAAAQAATLEPPAAGA